MSEREGKGGGCSAQPCSRQPWGVGGALGVKPLAEKNVA